MPIRTNRGRAAVYRRLWGWPLRSPRHLVVVCLFVLALVLFLSYILPRLTGGSGQAGPAAATSSSGKPTSSATAPPSQGAPGVVPPPNQRPDNPQTQATPTATRITPSETLKPVPASNKATEVAVKWAEAWVKHDGVSAQDWVNGLRPYTTDEYLPTFSTTDPQTVPSSKVTGPPSTKNSLPGSATVLVPTDKVKLSLVVIEIAPGVWRVSEQNEEA